MSWRDKAAPVIATIVRDVGRKDPKALRKALREGYPFGDRTGWPYKAWLAEIKIQIGGMRQPWVDPKQMRLFD